MSYTELANVIEKIVETKRTGGHIDLLEICSQSLIRELGDKWLYNFALIQYLIHPNGDEPCYICIGDEITYIELIKRHKFPLNILNDILLEILEDNKWVPTIGKCYGTLIADVSLNVTFDKVITPSPIYVNYNHFKLGLGDIEASKKIIKQYTDSVRSVINYLMYGTPYVKYSHMYPPLSLSTS